MRKSTWEKTQKKGVYSVTEGDGTTSYIATWKVKRPLNIMDPLSWVAKTVTKEAATFEEACRLQAEGEAAERVAALERSPETSLAERMMAAGWFRYWVRR